MVRAIGARQLPESLAESPRASTSSGSRMRYATSGVARGKSARFDEFRLKDAVHRTNDRKSDRQGAGDHGQPDTVAGRTANRSGGWRKGKAKDLSFNRQPPVGAMATPSLADLGRPERPRGRPPRREPYQPNHPLRYALGRPSDIGRTDAGVRRVPYRRTSPTNTPA